MRFARRQVYQNGAIRVFWDVVPSVADVLRERIAVIFKVE